VQVHTHALVGAALALGALSVTAMAVPATSATSAHASPAAPVAVTAVDAVAPTCTSVAPAIATIRLVPTAPANGAAGTAELRFAPSPFGAAVSSDGRLVYRAEVRTSGLPTGAVRVVWAASPDLTEVSRLGTLDADGALSADIDLNKFLIFITGELSADVDRWSGPILLRGISPSGRMHTMAGHGPFSSEPCGTFPPTR
jgi:hypothetical protein